MVPPLDVLAHGFAQVARVGWYWGQYRVAQSLAPSLAATEHDEPPQIPGAGAVIADLMGLLRRDLADVAKGFAPARPLDPRRIGEAARNALAFFADVPAVNLRRRLRAHSEVFERPVEGAPDRRLPRYYLQNFHFQTDGYLSPASAARYDHQVEVLFSGGGQAMRRRVLAPLAQFFADRKHLGQGRVLDVATGAGNVLGELRRHFPALDVVGLDLSRAYLSRAAAVAPGAGLVEANAEHLPVADASIDAATCVFLFHELPRAARVRVAGEIARALKPGGLFVFVDSIQPGDHPPYDSLIARFPVAFHEPYYADYARTDLPELFADAGLTLVASERAFFAKVMTLAKPPA
jgi:ubiquinone/menaquinone biosynthesis C-methylase UbiE